MSSLFVKSEERNNHLPIYNYLQFLRQLSPDHPVSTWRGAYRRPAPENVRSHEVTGRDTSGTKRMTETARDETYTHRSTSPNIYRWLHGSTREVGPFRCEVGINYLHDEFQSPDLDSLKNCPIAISAGLLDDLCQDGDAVIEEAEMLNKVSWHPNLHRIMHVTI